MADSYVINVAVTVRRADGARRRAELHEIEEALTNALDGVDFEAGDYDTVYEVDSAALA